MVHVLTFVMDQQVVEQTEVCYQDVVVPGVNLLSFAAHAPSPTVLQPRLVTWEEVPAQIFQPRRGHGHFNILFLRPPLWRCQVVVEISDHQ